MDFKPGITPEEPGYYGQEGVAGEDMFLQAPKYFAILLINIDISEVASLWLMYSFFKLLSNMESIVIAF